ncbi:MAG: hypothetical protein FJX72_11685 [Armatimonadetes bacterium]|nr:hypothetical protein [Armatimonadota bacterium]
MPIAPDDSPVIETTYTDGRPTSHSVCFRTGGRSLRLWHGASERDAGMKGERLAQTVRLELRAESVWLSRHGGPSTGSVRSCLTEAEERLRRQELEQQREWWWQRWYGGRF